MRVGQVLWGQGNRRWNSLRDHSLQPRLLKRGEGAGHPMFILNFRVPLRNILHLRVIAVYFADTGLQFSVCHEFPFDLYVCKNTSCGTPRKLCPCLFATCSLIRASFFCLEAISDPLPSALFTFPLCTGTGFGCVGVGLGLCVWFWLL